MFKGCKSPLAVAACNILILMLLYSLSRLFFYFINRDFFISVSGDHLWELCLGGMRFDLTAVLYLSSAYLIMMLLPLRLRGNRHYMNTAWWLLAIPNIIGMLVNCADMVYFRFTDRRTTCTFFSEFAHDDNLLNILLTSLWQYWYVTLFAVALVAIFILLSRKKVSVEFPATGGRRAGWYVLHTVVMCVTVYFIVIGIRGGFGWYTRPLTISNALQYTDTPQETAIVLNTPFTLLKSLEYEPYSNPHYYTDEELETVWSPVTCNPPASDSLSDRNIVIIILESFSTEFIGYLNRVQDTDSLLSPSYTPFLDSLLSCSRTYSHSYATGRKSIDAMPSVLSSIPMLIEPYIVTPYSTNAVMSIASCLRDEGYATAFYHGAPNGSMGFQAYARSAGFEHYFGMDEYDGPSAFDGTWAVWDEEFLQYFARSLSALEEPFCSAVFTASSHHPFKVPDRYEGVFPKGTQPIHQCIGYTDNALRQFFASAKKQSWYGNTLFVITADHTNQLSLPRYTNADGLFRVPVAFYLPDNSLAGMSDMVVSQVDIMPSVLSFLGYGKPYVAFGEDVLTTGRRRHPYIVNYNHPVYQVISDSLLVQFDGSKVTAVYDLPDDPCLTTNLAGQLQNDGRVGDMVAYLKACIQQYIVRMTDNRLTE